jgi:endonuclease/exonuclease/phosphatase family metal-dependent hydrolase
MARAEVITIATYNLENYTVADRRVEGTFRPAYPKPESEKAALRQTIRTLQADVLALQEMGPRPYLEELRGDLRREGLNYPFEALAEADDADRHLAVLSRRPLGRAETIRDLRFRYFDHDQPVKRGVLAVTLTVAGRELTLFVLHLHSRFTERVDDPNSARWRSGEARAVRDCVLQRFPDPAAAWFLLLGDCNDTKSSSTLRLLSRRGSKKVALPLEALDSAGESWTYFYGKEDSYSRVDFILQSPGLAAAGSRTAGVASTSAVMTASDHRPVWVKLDLPETAR